MIPEIVFIFGTLGNSLFNYKITHNQASQIIEERENNIKGLVLQQNQEEQYKAPPEKEDVGEEEGEEEIETIIEEEPSLPYEFAREEEKPELLTLKGYFRSRFFFYSGIPEVKVKKHEDQNLDLKYKNPFYIQSRLRLDPYFNISPT
jgi:hypothetical protein